MVSDRPSAIVIVMGADFLGETRCIEFQQTDVAVPRDKTDVLPFKLLALVIMKTAVWVS
jgi:hypothetical protein